ncbi:hypothetical protein [Methyloversatilis discipulorum]|uniref:hypothetical protein n=1 Tax=Methyloversatilis discipulorum TaxID=1119528 RepID=UPI003F2DB498
MSWMFNTDGTLSDYDTGATVSPNATPWWGSSQPSNSDSGWNYGQDVLDVLKYGAGILMQREQAAWEDKRLYEQAANGIALQGQAAAIQAQAAGLRSTGLSGSMPLILIGGAVLVVAVLLLKD